MHKCTALGVWCTVRCTRCASPCVCCTSVMHYVCVPHSCALHLLCALCTGMRCHCVWCTLARCASVRSTRCASLVCVAPCALHFVQCALHPPVCAAILLCCARVHSTRVRRSRLVCAAPCALNQCVLNCVRCTRVRKPALVCAAPCVLN